MNRSVLRWFFLAVQFVMLAVSIPKVAMLFHAYDPKPIGPPLGGIDIRSWGVGLVIDLTVAVTTWAALQKYEATGKRVSLLAPGVIIAICSGISVVANYEDAATIMPEQYAHVSLFTHPALLINPILISAPPLIVLLLIIIVPSVLASPRMKTPAEIAAETAHKKALIEAKNELRIAQLGGLRSALKTVTARAEDAPSVEVEARIEQPTERVLSTPSARVSKAMWDAMSLKERVLKSGLITPQEVHEVLGMSVAHARRLIAEVRASNDESSAVPGRTGVPFQSLIDALYARHTKDSFAQAQKLERALGLKKTRALHAVGDAGDNPTIPLIEEESGESVG
jgi:hypothetical protein